MTVIHFKFVSTEKLAKCESALGKAKQLKSVLGYIHKYPFSLTHEIASRGLSINVPQSVKTINERIAIHGAVINHYLPTDRHIDSFGNKSQLHRWYLEELNE